MTDDFYAEASPPSHRSKITRLVDLYLLDKKEISSVIAGNPALCSDSLTEFFDAKDELFYSLKMYQAVIQAF